MIFDKAWKQSYFWLTIIVFATANAILRPSQSIPVTPFYVLMPFILFILTVYVKLSRKWMIVFLGVAIYGLVVGTSFGVPFKLQIAQILKYAQLLTFLLLLSWLYCRGPISQKRLRRTLGFLTSMVFLLAILQSVTGFEFANVINDESHLWLNTFFYTPNDLGLFLAGSACLVLCSDVSLLRKVIFFVAFFSLNLRNDAKAVVLAALVMLAVYLILKILNKLRIRPVIGLTLILVMVPLSLISIENINVAVGGSEFDLQQLLADPITRIINLEPYKLGGSIFDRTDALIYSVIALDSVHWVGLGPAGSIYNLSLPENELLTAKSLHNAIAEICVDFGPVALLLFGFLLRPFAIAIFSRKLSSAQVCLICFVMSSPFLSVSQSSGFISNYAFWLTAFLIWYPASTNQSIVRGHFS